MGHGGRVVPQSTDDVDRLAFAGIVHGRDHHGRGETPPPTRTRPPRMLGDHRRGIAVWPRAAAVRATPPPRSSSSSSRVVVGYAREGEGDIL